MKNNDVTKGKAMVVLSGGQDSTTVLYLVRGWVKPEDIHAVTFNYGQRHAVEVDSARKIASLAGIASHEVVDLGAILVGTSPLVNPAIDVEAYTDAASLPGGIEKTFVPMRNALFLTVAANRAVAKGCTSLHTGVSQEDYGGYPDCRDGFIRAMNMMIAQAIGEAATPPRLYAPLLHLNKANTVQLGLKRPGCMEALAFSHTCYRGEYPPCGTCHACILRAKGFKEAGVADPLMERGA